VAPVLDQVAVTRSPWLDPSAGDVISRVPETVVTSILTCATLGPKSYVNTATPVTLAVSVWLQEPALNLYAVQGRPR